MNSTNIEAEGGLLKSGGTMTGILNYSSEFLTYSSLITPALSSDKNIHFINVSESITSTVTIPDGTVQGEFKIIIIDYILPGGLF